MIPEDVLDKIHFVASYIGDSTDDWLTIKQQIVISLPWKHRSLFSRRHEQSKKQVINDFEKEVMEEWEKKTGVCPAIDSAKLHDPTKTIRKHGWALPNRSNSDEQ
jgi:hypothetical protein